MIGMNTTMLSSFYNSLAKKTEVQRFNNTLRQSFHQLSTAISSL